MTHVSTTVPARNPNSAVARRIAYLTNQYPKVSHSFIRREIAALEALGYEVARFTMREVDEPLVDADDLAERARTTVLIDGARSLATSTARWSARSPRGFAAAVADAAWFAARASSGNHRVAGYLAAACRLADELETRGITHVHAHFGTNPAAVAMLCHTLTGISFSFTVHGPEEFDAMSGLALDRKIAAASFVVAISDFGKSQLRRITPPESWSKIVTVRCGLDARFVDAAPVAPPDVRRLVSVGRIAEQKGQLTLIDATARAIARSGPFELVLVGDGPMRGAIEARARSLGIDAHVRITGWADGATVRRELEASRAFVLPSYAEGLPIVLMESLALARPTITTFVAGIPELVVHRENGWLVPAGDVDSLADAIVECLAATPSELFAMGRRGRAAVLARHDARANAASLAAHFEAVLGARAE